MTSFPAGAESRMRCLVRGRVQGVSFRAATRRRALELGLEGYVRNLEDGRVEVYAKGPGRALADLRQWLCEGPPLAQVNEVECTEAREEAVDQAGFTIVN